MPTRWSCRKRRLLETVPREAGRSHLKLVNRAFLFGGLLVGSPLIAPQLLAFPHKATIGGHAVYSEQPIGPEVARVVADADKRMSSSPLGGARPLDQPIFLTDGGWRWQWLSAFANTSLALSRPIGDPVIVHRSDPSRDLLFFDGRANGPTRRLSDVLVHELTHGAIRAEFGLIRAARMPTELVEGYADHVAGSSTLSDEQARAMLRSGQRHPALPYWTGRKKVERALVANDGDVRRLFNEWR